MSTLTDKYGPAWQMATLGVGAIVTGLSDIRQCIDIILRTAKGQDPFRPLFGSDIWQWVDKPVNIAGPNIAREIIEAIGIWETRIAVKSVTYSVDKDNLSNLQFTITYTVNDQDLLDTYIFNTSGETTSSQGGQLILQCIIPTRQTDQDVWFMSFVGDRNSVIPNYPTSGFDNVDDMFTWIVDNWSVYGSWYMTGNKIILYLKSGLFTTATIDCTRSSGYVLKAKIPDQEGGEFLTITFKPLGQLASPIGSDQKFYTAGDLLDWCKNNWSDYGQWSISNNTLVLRANADMSNSILTILTNGLAGFTIGFSKGFNS